MGNNAPLPSLPMVIGIPRFVTGSSAFKQPKTNLTLASCNVVKLRSKKELLAYFMCKPDMSEIVTISFVACCLSLSPIAVANVRLLCFLSIYQVLVAAGQIEKLEVVEVAKKLFNELPSDPTTRSQLELKSPALFTGSEVSIIQCNNFFLVVLILFVMHGT